VENGRSIPPELASEWLVKRVEKSKDNEHLFNEDSDDEFKAISFENQWDETEGEEIPETNTWKLSNIIKSISKKKIRNLI
jgi:hypothetical protein